MLNYSIVQNTKVLLGLGSVAQAGELLKTEGYGKAFIVYDTGVREAGIITRIIKSLEESGIEYVEYDRVQSDPPAEIVDEGGALCRKSGCDCVIAVGGGSAIDTAKGINILRFNQGKILEYSTPGVDIKKCSGLLSIPTTSGTGSELSNGLIISDTEHNLKIAILAVNAMSEYAILDSELTVGMPVGLTLTTGLDVFSHVAEGYTSVLANTATDMMCEKIMETVVENLPIVLKNGNDLQARDKMHVSASLGGWMLTNSGAHVGHSVAHVIGGKFHIVHGAACAYGLPAVLKLITPECMDKVKKIGIILGANYIGTETVDEIGDKAAKAYIHFRDVVLGLKSIKEYKLEIKDINEIAQAVVNEPLAGLCPKKVNKEDAVKLLTETLGL